MTLAEAVTAGRPAIPAPHGVGLAELALGVGGLAIGTGEFAAMGVLPDVANDIGISIPDAGHMISAYAIGVVVGAPLITILFARVPRRAMLIGLMIVFALGNFLSALASNYVGLITARFLAGLPHGAYFGVASLVAASMVAENKRAQAIGKIMLGLSVANVIGVPTATWLGQAWGWHATFIAVGAIAALTALLVSIYIPKVPVLEGASARRELGAFGQLQLWLTLGVASIGFGGLFAVYSYITPTLTEVTGIKASTVPILLAVLGTGMIAGSIVGGWLADRALKATMVGMLIWNGAMLGLFVYTSAALWSVTINMFLIGCCIAIVPALQTRLMDVAGDAQTLAAALNHSAFNIANALGAWLGGLAIAAGLGWTSTGWVGVALAVGGLAILMVSFAVEKRRPV